MNQSFLDFYTNNVLVSLNIRNNIDLLLYMNLFLIKNYGSLE